MRLEDLPELHENDEIRLVTKSTIDVTVTIPILRTRTKVKRGFYRSQGNDGKLGPYITINPYRTDDWRGDTKSDKMYILESVIYVTKK